MSDFSPDDYFTRKLEQSGASLPDISVTPEAREKRFEEVMRASEEKLRTLQEIRDHRAITEQQNAQSLVSKMGLDPNSTAGRSVNAVANVSQGAMSHVLGNIASFVAADVPAMILDGQLQDHEIEAINRYKMGKASAADMDLITSKQIQRMEGTTHNPNMDSPEALAIREASAQNNPLVRTPLELFEASSQVKKFGEKIDKAFDYSKMVHQEAREKFTNDLKRDFQPSWDKTGLANLFSDDKEIGNAKDIAAGLGELMVNAGDAIINNPTGFSEYVFENTPQLLVGALPKVGATILTATNVGYATEQYRKGIAEFQAANNGAVPSKEQRKEMAMWAATAGLMEHVTDSSLLKTIKGPADEAVDATRKGFKAALGTVGTAATTGTVKEGFTEGVQTYAEAKAQLKDPDAADIYVGTVIGAGSGGVMTGSGSAVVTAGKGLAERANANAAVEKKAKVEAAAIQAAAQTNDTTAFLDPESASYSPESAVAVLSANTDLPTTTPEAKTANLEQATKIVSDMDAELEAGWGKLFDLEKEGKTDKTTLKSMQMDLDAKEARLKQARSVKDDLAAKVTSVAQVKELVAEANKPAAEADTAKVEQVINLAMKSPALVSQEEAQELAENTANGLTSVQREYFRSFSESRIAQNALQTTDGVSKDIFEGSATSTGRQNIGIKQRIANVTEAISMSNLTRAKQEVAGITKFAESHSEKAAAVTEAWSMYQDKGTVSQVIMQGGKWQVVPDGTVATDKELKAMGGLKIYGASSKIAAAIPVEAAALKATAEVLRQGVEIAFNPKPATASVTPAVQTPAAPSSAASVPSAATQQTTDTAPAVEAAAETAKAVEGVAESKNNTKPVVESKTQDQAPQKEIVTAEEKSVDSAPLDRTDENSGSTVRSTETVEDTTQEATKEEVSEGTLKVFAKKLVRNIEQTMTDLYNSPSFNQVAQFLKQEKINEADASVRPLVAKESFISNWIAGNIKAEDYLDLGKEANKRELTEEEQSALKNLQKFIAAWMPRLQQNFTLDTDTQAAFRNDRMQDFYTVDENGVVDTEENVKAAIAYAMYSYILDKANSPAIKTKKEVAKMHKSLLVANGKWDENHPQVSPEGLAVLQEMDVLEETLVNELGERVVQALGLKAAGKDTPQDVLSKLAVAFGTHALFALGRNVKQGDKKVPGFITVVELPMNDVYDYFDIDPIAENRTVLKYVKFRYEAEKREDGSVNKYGLSDRTRSIRDANAGSHGVVDKLFGVEHTPREALDTPTPMKQEYAKGTKQQVSKIQRKAVGNTQKAPHTVIHAMKAVMDKFGEMTILRAAGWKEIDHEDPNYHVMNRAGIEAQNHNLEDQLDQMTGMWNKKDGLEKARYVIQSVWRNFRAGFSNGSLNQQSSKIHRFMFSRPEWTTTIKFNDQELVNEFLISAAMAMGEKTDGQRNVNSLAKYFDNLNTIPVFKNEKVMQAIRSIQRAIHQDITPTEQEIALVQEVASEAEGMMSLQAMQVYADFLQAKESQKESFEVSMLVGADGKTNGPMLTLFALGATDYDTLNRGGFYSTDEGQAEHYSAYAESDGARDIYQDVGSAVVNDMRGKTVTNSKDLPAKLAQHRRDVKEKKANYLDTPFSLEQAGHFIHLTGALYNRQKDTVEKALRNLVKTPLTAFFFGSSLKNSAKSMENAFVDSWYETIEKIKQGKQKPGMTLASFIKATNGVITTGNPGAPVIPENMDIDTAMKYMMYKNKEQDAAFRKGFQILMGNSVQSAFKPYFEKFIERRNQINSTVHGAYSIYEAVYNSARKKMIEELMDKGEIAFRVIGGKGPDAGTKVPLHDLTVGQEAELKERVKALQPVAHNAMSHSENNLDAGSFMAKEAKDVSKSKLYEAVVMLKNGKRRNTGMVRKMVDNGVGSLSAFIHSLDSANMHMALNKVPGSMNVHDEIGNGVDKISTAAKAINQTTSENLLNFSPAREAFNLLERSVIALVKGIKDGSYSEDVAKQIVSSWITPAMEDVPLNQVASTFIAEARIAAKMADYDRLGLLAKLKSTDQYTWEGGQFVADQAFRDKAAAMREANSKEPMSTELTEAVKFLGKINYTNTTVVESKPDQETKVEMVEVKEVAKEATEVKAKTSPLGKLGQSAIASDPELVSFFEKNPKPSIQEALTKVLQLLQKTAVSRTDKLKMHLASQLLKSLENSTFEVRYITATSKESDVVTMPLDGSMGWYGSDTNGNHAIHLFSPEFASSGLTPEVVLHEMLHGALARLIEQEKGKKSHAGQLIAELQSLMDEATKKVGSNPQFAEAIKDLHEFVSWGMTNESFQTKILSQISLPEGTTTNRKRLVTGMKKFINLVTGILFKNTTKTKEEVLNSGMSVLIQNVSGLLNQSQQNSAPKDINQSQIGTATYTTQTLFDALNSGSISQEHSNHLQNLLGTIVEKLHGPFGSFKEQFMTGAVGTATDIFAKAIVTGKAPFAFNLQNGGLKISDQELFAAEQIMVTVQTALDDKVATSRMAYRELSKLYLEAKAKFTPADFADPADYDAIFKMEVTNGKTDHLARFAALGLAHQEFNRMLKVPTKARAHTLNKTFSQWLQSIFDDILEMFTKRVTATYEGQRADIKLENLVSQLVDIEAKRIVAVARKGKTTDYTGIVDEKLADGVQALTTKLENLSKSSFFTQSKNSFVKAAGMAGSTILGGRQQLFMQVVSDMRDKMNAGTPGLAAGLWNELKDPSKLLHRLLRLSKHRDKHMVHVKTETAKFARGGFMNQGNDLTKEQTEGVTSIFLRTGAHNLLGKFDMAQITNLLADRTALEKAINDAVIELGKSKYRHYYDFQAKVLGYHLATDKTKGELLLQNTGSIASLSGTPLAGRVTAADAKVATDILNVLVTLYALKYSNPNEVTQALAVLRKEGTRTDGGNGVHSLMLLHKDLEKDAREKNFAGNESLMVHGFTSEIYNPHIDVVTAEVAVEGKDLIDQGWEMVGLVESDPADPNQEQKALYRMRDAGAQPLVTGSMAYQDLSAAGTGKHTGNLNQNTLAGTNNSLMIQGIAAHKAQKIMDMFKPNQNFDPSLVKGNRAAPIMNAKGEVTNWRYLMHKRTKDNVLERDNRFDQVLGQMAASTFDKSTVTENNTNVVKGLHEIYKDEFAGNVDRFINIGPNSSNAEMREIYRLLPKATRDVVEEVWGRDGMMVRKDQVDIVFGYHKLSMSTMFDKLQTERTYFEHAFTFTVEHMLTVYVTGENQLRKARGLPEHDPKKYVRRASMVVRKSERIWQAIVQEMKDIIVIKTGTVMIGNIISNFMLLKMNGVPLGDMVRDTLIAARSVREYQNDQKTLFDLETKLSLGLGNAAQIEAEIARLNDAISRNPVKELIDAGLMPTIAEDVESTEDPYSYKSALTHKVEKFAAKLHPSVLATGKFVYMTRDTKMYQALNEATMLSDFVARYALVQHLTTRKDNQLNKEDAIQEASDAFINYDIPMHRKMTYSDDMGFTLFSKYFLRVQRVLMKLFKEHPGNVLATIAFHNYIMELPTALESSVIERFGNNPLRTGMFGYPGVVDELATVNATLSLMK